MTNASSAEYHCRRLKHIADTRLPRFSSIEHWNFEDISAASSFAKPAKQNSIMKQRDYANRVDAHAKLSAAQTIYPGTNYADLASYLLQPWQSYAYASPPRGSGSKFPIKAESFVSLYKIRGDSIDNGRHYLSTNELFENEADCNSIQGRLLFIRGHVAPEWLNALGAKFRIDPEFFQRHLDFRGNSEGSNSFSIPAMPSDSTRMTRLRLITIGSRTKEHSRRPSANHDDLELLRSACDEQLGTYLVKLIARRETEAASGTSIVRHVSIHDAEHFSLEQDISVFCTSALRVWLGVVWLDVGRDLNSGLSGPWTAEFFRVNSLSVSYLPTIQRRPDIALDKQVVSMATASTNENESSHLENGSHHTRVSGMVDQTAARLHIDYGKRKNHTVSMEHPFGILLDIFKLSSASQLQHLNMIHTKVRKEWSFSRQGRPNEGLIRNLQCWKQDAERQIDRLQENRDFIEAQLNENRLARSGTSQRSSRSTMSEIEVVFKDFDYLLNKAQRISSECDQILRTLMNTIMILESQKGILQAEANVKLTRLAFFFIPLAFTTSFFGMNFSQFNIGSPLGIWTWFAVSIPILFVSMSFMAWDIPGELSGLLRSFLRGRG